MEPRFGQDFGNVRIHQGPTAETAAASLQARAFTLGRDVVFAAGEHDPKSEGGKRLLAHELTHVVQQRGSVRAGSIQREEGSGASLAPPFRRGLGMRAPYRLEIGDPRSDTSVHSSWYTLLPSIVGISMDAFTQRYPAVDDSWYKRLVELGLTVGWQVPWMVLSHEYGHYRVGEREGWDPDVSLTSWYSGVTEYTNRAAYAAAPESAQIEASAAGVNQERLNSMRMFIDWALNNSIDPHEAFAFLASRTNMALYAARSSVGGGTGGKDDLLAYQSRTGTSTEKVLVLAAASDLLSASTWGAFIPIFSRFLARGERRFEIPSVELGGVRTTWPNFHVLLGTEGPIVGAQAVVGVDRPMPVEITIDTGIDEFAFALGAKVHGVPLADRLTASPFLRATIADPPGVVVGTDLRYDLSRTLSITGTLEYRRNDLLAEPTGKREGLGGSLSVGISLP